ncbi:MAG: hypothetical protein HQ580_09980 [Planctomycetes bacterium]|nr:hypothetical protein [Planctomycetota bacterium]
MNKPKYAKMIFFCAILTIGVWYGPAQSQPTLSAQKITQEVGRENPFAKISRSAQSISPTAFQSSQPAEETPKLFIETIKLKFLNAAALSSALKSFSSRYGSVAADPKNNSLIICDTKEILARIIAEVYKIDIITQQIMFVETKTLKFLKADNLKTTLSGMLSQYGSIAVDDSTNSLIICDTKDHLEKIASEIKKADKTPEQIMVEVVIVDVQLGDDTEIGINWDILSDKTYDIGYRQNFTTRLGTAIENEANIGNATAFNTTGIGGDFSVISGNIRNVVAMLQKKKDVEILASPRVMVLSGKTASIKAVEEVPYEEIVNTSEGGSMSSTKFKEVGVTLDVTATLTEGNHIYLILDAMQNVTTGESVNQVPVVDTRNIRTELLLNDSQVVVMGGLRRKETTKQIHQVPILGDIPLIGLLFKYTNTVVKNSELIVFISPHVYKKDEPIPEDAMAKFKEIRDKPMPLSEKDRNAKKNKGTTK